MKASPPANQGPPSYLIQCPAVALSTGLKSWPVVWAMSGDPVKVQGHRGTWKITSIEQRIPSLAVNVEVYGSKGSRIFPASLLTAVKHLSLNDVRKN
jgi:hypothetical protein